MRKETTFEAAPASGTIDTSSTVADAHAWTGETAGTPGIGVVPESTPPNPATASDSATTRHRGARVSLSELGGRVALFFIMLFATVEAASLLGLRNVFIQER